MKTVCGAQSECINALKSLMLNFLNGKNTKGYTKVFPLSIPTGWGKTRIAIQSILKVVSNKSVNVVLWPQNKNHVKRIWQRPGDWKGEGKKKFFFIPCWNPLNKKVNLSEFRYFFYRKNNEKFELDDCNETSFKPYQDVKFYWISNRFSLFNGNVENLRNNLKDDPIFYIIDEWHSFDLINEFREDCKQKGIRTPSKKMVEKFWRNRLLFGNCKKNKLFILLLSATPIASADAMDKIFDKADSLKRCTDYEEDDADAMQAVRSDLKLFDLMTQVNINKTQHKAHTVFPDVLEKRSEDLKFIQKKYKNAKEYKSIIKKFPLKSFADYYISVAKKIATSKIEFPYLREQSIFAEEDSLKVKFLKTFLKRCPHNQRILIFCHHRSSVAEKLECSLKKEKDFKDKIVYLGGDASNSKISDYIDDFNNPNGKVRYLIATDMYSQGIDLQKTNAWILHYELAWNPIRIIQRFGRVWRMNNPGQKTKELSRPLAFHMPLSYSSEEEQLNRLRRRWKTLSEILPNNKKLMKPIDFEIALGIRLTPEPK